MALSTVSGVAEADRARQALPARPPEPPNRYERKRPGELVHVDIKKLGASAEGGRASSDWPPVSQFSVGPKRSVHGWECSVHVCVDDATRLAYVEVLARRARRDRRSFLRRAVRWFAERSGSTSSGCSPTTAPLPLNASHAAACLSSASATFAPAPTAPHQRQGRALHPDAAARWAYGAIYGTSAERTAALAGWLTAYNFTDRHGSLGHAARRHRLDRAARNLLGNYS